MNSKENKGYSLPTQINSILPSNQVVAEYVIGQFPLNPRQSLRPL